MNIEAFNGNFYGANGKIFNLDGKSISGPGIQDNKLPFNGNFIDSEGKIRNIEELKGDGGGSGTPTQSKRYATFVIGTSTSGHAIDEVDYLCDGVADDVEINAAITALPATGGTVLLREGTYNLSATILLNKNNTTIEGAGVSTIINIPTAASGTYIITCTRDSATIRNLKILSEKMGISVAGTDCLIENNYIYSKKGRCIYISPSTGPYSVLNNIVSADETHGIYMGNSTGVICCGNRVLRAQWGIATGLDFYSGVISQNTISNTTIGILLSNNARYNTISNNTITDSGESGIHCQGSAGQPNRYNIIANNAIFNPKSAGINTTGTSTHLTITNNLIYKETYASSEYSMNISGSHCLVEGNMVIGKDITISGANHTVVNNKYQ